MLRVLALFPLALLLMPACSTAPKKDKVTLAQQVGRDNELGSALSKKFEPTFTLKNDPLVTAYLRKVALRITSRSPALQESPIGIFIIDNQSATWRNYSIPGVRVYLSSGLLRRMEFENEVAAAIGFELGHIMSRHVARKVAGDKIPETIFQYSDQELEDSLKAAVEVLYQAGYDSRGLVSLWNIYAEEPKYSPFSTDQLERLIELTYEHIAQTSPLRNPMIQSSEFVKLRPRIRNL